MEITSSALAHALRGSDATLPWRRDVQDEHRVLLVDDGRHGHMLLSGVAASLGMAVHHARSIADSVRHALKFSYDVLLVDATLGGKALLPLLRQLAAMQPRAAVLISGEGGHMPEDAALEPSLIGSVPKPWNEEELDASLRRAIALSGARRARGASSAPPRASFQRLLLVARSGEGRRIGRLLRARTAPGGVVHAESLTEALALCGERPFDVVLTDTCLADACGLDAVIRLRRALPQAATVALTSSEDPAFADQALQAGAQDVLLKSKLDAEGLVRSLEHAVSRQRAQAHREYGALHDELTNLAKRTLLQQRISNALARSRRMGNTFALIYIDLDHFKRINDEHGHDAGDEVLVAVSQRLRGAVREYDTVARLGGDEFAILLDTLDEAGEAQIVAQRVLDSLAPPVSVDGRELTVTASIGVSVFPEGGEVADELLKNADRAMYCAKRSGRNTYSLSPSASHPTELDESGAAPVHGLLSSG